MLNSNEVLAGNFQSSRRFGTQPGGFFHNGIDFPAPTGTPVKARHSGVIHTTGTNPPGQDFGNYIRMTYDTGLDGWFAHLESFNVKVGQRVNAGDVIGHSNNTGMSTGSHLHYSESEANSLHWIDPDTTQEGGEPMIQDTDNEYARWKKGGQFIRGRDLSRDEFRAAAVGKAWLTANEVLEDDGEADNNLLTLRLGQLAQKDDWEGQIKGLNTEIEGLQKQLANLPSPTPSPTPVPSQGLTGYNIGDLLREVFNRIIHGGN